MCCYKNQNLIDLLKASADKDGKVKGLKKFIFEIDTNYDFKIRSFYARDYYWKAGTNQIEEILVRHLKRIGYQTDDPIGYHMSVQVKSALMENSLLSLDALYFSYEVLSPHKIMAAITVPVESNLDSFVTAGYGCSYVDLDPQAVFTEMTLPEKVVDIVKKYLTEMMKKYIIQIQEAKELEDFNQLILSIEKCKKTYEELEQEYVQE